MVVAVVVVIFTLGGFMVFSDKVMMIDDDDL